MIRNLAHEVYLGSLYTGELAESFPSTGDGGPGPGNNDNLTPGLRYRIKVITPPTTGVLVMDDVRGIGMFIPSQDGTEQAVYQLEEEGAVVGTANMFFNIGQVIDTSLTATEGNPLTFNVLMASDVDFVSDASVEAWTLTTGAMQAPVVPVITQQPVDGNTLTVTAANATGYQWFQDDKPVRGETSNTYVATVDGLAYCLVIGASGFAIASATVNTISTPIPQYQGSVVDADGTTFRITYHTAVTGTLGFSFTRDGGGAEALTGGVNNGTEITFTGVSPTIEAGETILLSYDDVAGNVQNASTGEDAPALTDETTTNNSAVGVVVTANPISQFGVIGGSLIFTVQATLSTGFQWYRNDAPIPGATTFAYATPTLAQLNNGDRYFCRCFGKGGLFVDSTEAVVSIMQAFNNIADGSGTASEKVTVTDDDHTLSMSGTGTTRLSEDTADVEDLD